MRRTEEELNQFESDHKTYIWESDAIEVDHKNVCEGCWHCEFPGIRWPASPDGFNDLSYVDRCDYCERFKSDEEAAKWLAEKLGVRWGWAYRTANPKTEDDIRWEPNEDDGLSYTGWSAFIDREERDGSN